MQRSTAAAPRRAPAPRLSTRATTSASLRGVRRRAWLRLVRGGSNLWHGIYVYICIYVGTTAITSSAGCLCFIYLSTVSIVVSSVQCLKYPGFFNKKEGIFCDS